MTIREVAERAGVSAATVSRVFSQPHVVSVPTRQRVMAAAQELGYTPNPVARSLARGETGNLGLVVPDVTNAFAAVTTKAVLHQARRDGYALFIADSDLQERDEQRQSRAMAAQVDGLVLAWPSSPDDRIRDLAAATPVVLINRVVPGVPAVLMQTAAGTAHAVEHLHALGHRDVVYLAGPDNYSNASRLHAYRESCRRLGMSAEELGPFEATFSSGVRAADLILARTATAAVAYNDEITVGVINRLADRGLRVPADLSIVGHDDTMLAEMVTPRLTTVRLPATAAGTAAVRLLLDVMNGEDVTAHTPVELSAELVIRSSTGPVPDGSR